MVQLASDFRRGRVNPSNLHDLAQRRVRGRDAPLIERQGVCSLEILSAHAGHVLLRNVDPANCYERRQLFGPLDRELVDRHLLKIGTQLGLQLEVVRLATEFTREGRAKDIGSGAQVERGLEDVLSIGDGRRDADLGDVIAVSHGASFATSSMNR